MLNVVSVIILKNRVIIFIIIFYKYQNVQIFDIFIFC